jgi:hypothetical protein
VALEKLRLVVIQVNFKLLLVVLSGGQDSTAGQKNTGVSHTLHNMHKPHTSTNITKVDVKLVMVVC